MISAEEFLAGRGMQPRPASASTTDARYDAGTGPAEDAASTPLVPDAVEPIDDLEAAAAAEAIAEGAEGPTRPVQVRRGAFRHAMAEHPEDAEACKEAALRLLDAAGRSTGALRDKLVERGYDADVVDAVVGRLVALRLMDDEEYARSVVRSCVGRMYGRRGTERELVRKGVPRDVAQRVVQEAEDEGGFVEAAWALGRSVARKTGGKDMQVAMRRFWGAAGRKGHDAATVRQVADALFKGK